jgi:hypothetical protein
MLLSTYPTHTSPPFQVLDVLLFGRLKAFKKHFAKDAAEDREPKHIVKIRWAYEVVLTSMTIQESWEKASFTYQRRDQTSYFAIDERRIRTASDFREIWERDFPIDNLSAKRKNQKWRWLNQEFFRVKYLKQIKVRDVS